MLFLNHAKFWPWKKIWSKSLVLWIRIRWIILAFWIRIPCIRMILAFWIRIRCIRTILAFWIRIRCIRTILAFLIRIRLYPHDFSFLDSDPLYPHDFGFLDPDLQKYAGPRIRIQGAKYQPKTQKSMFFYSLKL